MHPICIPTELKNEHYGTVKNSGQKQIHAYSLRRFRKCFKKP